MFKLRIRVSFFETVWKAIYISITLKFFFANSLIKVKFLTENITLPPGYQYNLAEHLLHSSRAK